MAPQSKLWHSLGMPNRPMLHVTRQSSNCEAHCYTSTCKQASGHAVGCQNPPADSSCLHISHVWYRNSLQDQLEHFQELAHAEQMEAYAAVQRWAAAAQAAQQVLSCCSNMQPGSTAPPWFGKTYIQLCTYRHATFQTEPFCGRRDVRRSAGMKGLWSSTRCAGWTGLKAATREASAFDAVCRRSRRRDCRCLPPLLQQPWH
jgi:hypothetical protein